MKFNGVGPQIVTLAIVVLALVALAKFQPAKQPPLGKSISNQVSMLTNR